MSDFDEDMSDASEPVAAVAPKARTARAAAKKPAYTIEIDSDEEEEASEFDGDESD